MTTPINAVERLKSLTVGDVMCRDILTVSKFETLAVVAEKFRERHISSGPVVDEMGVCVGFLSFSDFPTDLENGEALLTLSKESATGSLNLESFSDRTAGQYMMTAVQSIKPSASLAEAARVMCGMHIHRLIVLDEDERPSGVCSTMDIVAALMNVFDELENSGG
jgi:CBS domain-containing protein